VLYNVPGRSGLTIAIETIERLSSNPYIVCVKEAGGSAERVSAIKNVCDITVLSGDDSLTLPMMSLGAEGVISVASNIIPAEVKAMVDAWKEGNMDSALSIHNKYYRFFSDLFIETNPIPIKAAMAAKNLINEEYRLPICPMNQKNRETLLAAMEAAGI
jgi:4-hydroxy-tetrahydrodipicolinate synthase